MLEKYESGNAPPLAARRAAYLIDARLSGCNNYVTVKQLCGPCNNMQCRLHDRELAWPKRTLLVMCVSNVTIAAAVLLHVPPPRRSPVAYH